MKFPELPSGKNRERNMFGLLHLIPHPDYEQCTILIGLDSIILLPQNTCKRERIFIFKAPNLRSE